MEDLKKIFIQYGGAIIGGIIALILSCTGLYRIVIALVLIGIGAYIGNYIQHNKQEAKDKAKEIFENCILAEDKQTYTF